MMMTIPQHYDTPLRQAILKAYHDDETEVVNRLLHAASLSASEQQQIERLARQLVEGVRNSQSGKGGLDAFLKQYHLSSNEGVALMCLAEALLRIPDKSTVDKLIRDKLTMADWESYLKSSDSAFVNAATWTLMLTGKLIDRQQQPTGVFKSTLKNLASRSGEPFIRKAVAHAMRILGQQFVMGRSIDEALKRARQLESKGYLYSYDMLGEAARTAIDAEKYYQAYQQAIIRIGQAAANKGPFKGPGISIKLSALHPRYEFAKHQLIMQTLVPKLLALAKLAKQYQISLTVDAEEADRLDLSLDVIEAVFRSPELEGWEGFGVAVQSYQKRAMSVLEWLADLAAKHQRRIKVRLIKGAYWDYEIKHAQVEGLAAYPVFTRKASTDVSFIACAKFILAKSAHIYPMFATHNAHSLATVLVLAGEEREFEFQCLHGMGQELYDQVVGEQKLNRACRIYAPVGGHEDLLAYLVRRLLENGANTSFVNRIVDASAPISDIIADPILHVAGKTDKPHPKIPLPIAIYAADRHNSQGTDLSDVNTLNELHTAFEKAFKLKQQAYPIINGEAQAGAFQSLYNPADHSQVVGEVCLAKAEQVTQAMGIAVKAQLPWDETPVTQRAAVLDKMADLLTQQRFQLMAILVREAGKTLADAIAECREAEDFCRYYAARAKELCCPRTLTGPTGELNQLSTHGRGVIVCISPWNFPLAIFLGQIAAALVVGNSVVAKPAEQTPLIATRAVELFHQAGIPKGVLQLLPGAGETVGAGLIADPRTAGVMFTGSTETARLINQNLANKESSITPLIAETGGMNAMIVDSSALPEQVVNDVVNSAFGSAGQRCSALRVLFVQQDIADGLITMLQGAMAELSVGLPMALATDVGPVIDKEAKAMLDKHIANMHDKARLIYQVSLSNVATKGYFVAPCAFEIPSISCLKREVFGPVLHVVRYASRDLDRIIDEINGTGYGLTLGIHSRVNETIEHIVARMRVGNTYVNRNMIGAVVGVQPFGGEGLSGTGPKAGGPHYLQRLCVERAISIDTTAAGGNASLVSLSEDD